MTKKIVEEYIKAHPGSHKLHGQAEKIFPANGATHTARLLDPFRPYITHAKGSKKWDVDGNEYIDYVMGHGALVLGHANPAAVEAVQAQVARGFHYGEEHELALEWAQLIQKMIPVAERVEFFACGQEANMMAVRMSRLFTGRKKVLRFVEDYHGWADELVVIGTPGTVQDEAKEIPGHNLDLLEKELATKEYAIVLLEGGGAHMAGQIPWDPDFVHAIPALTKKYGTVFLIDEVVTGFRGAPGGWQSIIGVTPDLTSLGKAVSGGVSAGALGGRADIMEMLKPKAPPQKFLGHAGTWNANPLTCSAGVAICKQYVNGEPQKKLVQMGDYLRKKGNQAMKDAGISGRLYGRNIVHLHLGPIDYEPSDDTLPPTKDAQKLLGGGAAKTELCLRLLQSGVATMGGRFFVMSAVHSEADVDQTLNTFISALKEMAAEGTVPTAK